MKRRTWLFLIATVLCLEACSIKEDRTPCPCWLTEDLSECYGSDSPLYLSAWKGGKLYLEGVEARLFPAGFEKKVPRDIIEVSAVRGIRESFLDGQRLLIPGGSQADSIFAYTCVVDARGESAYDLIMLHKQYANVIVDVEELDEKMARRMKVSGKSCGMDILSLKPIEGAFRCTPTFVRPGRCIFRVPRQTDGSLSLEIADKDGTTKAFAIGEDIIRNGYSWDEEDLQDIHIALDYLQTMMTITVLNWEKGEEKNYDY